MTTALETVGQHDMMPLTRMIYAVCGGILFYLLLEYSGQFFLARMHHVPWGMYRFDLWYYISDLCFVGGMFSAVVAYRFRAAVFCWGA